MSPREPVNRQPMWILLSVCSVVFVWSAIAPHSYDVWAFEIFAGVVGVGVLALTHRRFPFSNLVYFMVGLHFIILAVAAKYTYAETPLFNWIRDWLGRSRNDFDRVGHFFQGFVPGLIARELLLRKSPLERGKWLSFVVLCICLAISAFWELLECWFVLAFYREEGADWLGLQGDVWDAHWDMTMALLGGIVAVAAFARWQDRSLRRLEERTDAVQRGDDSGEGPPEAGS